MSSAVTYELLGRHAPDAPVMLCGTRVVTKSDLLLRAQSLIRQTARAKGAVFVVATAERDAVAVALLAAAMDGRRLVFPPHATEDAARAVAGGLDGTVLVHAGELGDGIDVRALDVEPGPVPSGVVVPADRPLAVFFTSGSTGLPKAHAKSAGALLGEAAMQAERLGVGPGSSVVSTVPPTHLYGFLFGLAMPMLSGARVALDAPGIPQSIAERAEELRADLLVGVPPHLRALAALFPEGVHHRPARVVSSGAPLANEDAVALASCLGARVEEILGSTETGGLGVRSADDAGFAPLPGVRFVAIVEGRLVVESAYIDSDEPGPRTTDERGALGPDGRFVHSGRGDDVIKVGATRVSLAEVECVLSSAPGVRDAVVRAERGTQGHGHRLVALVATDSPDGSQVRLFLSARLPAVAVPKRIVVVERIPRGAAGKVDDATWSRLFAGSRRREPSVRLARVPGDEHVYDVTVPFDSPAFDGHFPGRPILPGVVQLRDVVLASTRAEWPELVHPSRLSRLKFKRIVGPGESLRLVLARPTPERVQFVLSGPGGEAASGVLFFEGEPRP